MHESPSHDVRFAIQKRPGAPGRAGALLLLLRSHVNDRHRTFGERRCSICFPREHGGFSIGLHTRATDLPRVGPQETLLASGFERQPVGRVSLGGLSQTSRTTGSHDANADAGRDAKTLARRGLDEKRIVERFGSSWSEIIENDRKEADSRAYAREATLKPVRDIDWRTLMTLSPHGGDPKMMIALAFQEMASNAQKIGELNISPDLLQSLLASTTTNTAVPTQQKGK
jgi:hypothetical protein